jgi:transcriptional regulator with XRE-family HTH domain
MVGSSSGDYELPFGAALRRVRRSAGLSQEQLGLEAGVQRNFISLIETGQNQPTISTIVKLARALGLAASELVAEAEREATVATTKRARRRST